MYKNNVIFEVHLLKYGPETAFFSGPKMKKAEGPLTENSPIGRSSEGSSLFCNEFVFGKPKWKQRWKQKGDRR